MPSRTIRRGPEEGWNEEQANIGGLATDHTGCLVTLTGKGASQAEGAIEGGASFRH